MKWVVIILGANILLATPNASMSVSKRGDRVQLCGRRLAETLNMLCQGQYYDPGEENVISKRDVAQQTSPDFYPSWFLGWPSPKFNEFNHQYSYNRRHVGGVVDECCRKPCTVSVLMSYCSTTST